jgi:ArsR family transcriptional regulator, lead/cadmium/zinc/bismuth-responsive transcriptional repressor
VRIYSYNREDDFMAKFNDSIETCSCNIIHEEVVSSVRAIMLEEEKSFDLAEFFKVFGDTTRIKILYALSEAEMCVCDIAALLNMNQSAISHQLRILKQSKLVKYRKEGKIVYYSLDDEHVKEIFHLGLVHINER